MNSLGEWLTLESLVSLISDGYLTSSEEFFLLRRLGYRTDAEAWAMLEAYYGHPRDVLAQIEQRVLLRLSEHGLAQARASLDRVPPGHPDSALSAIEYANLNALLAKAGQLRMKAAKQSQPRPDPAALLAKDSKPRRSTPRAIQQPAARASAAPDATQPVDRTAPISDFRLPAHMPTQPDALLESLWRLHGWLVEQPRSVNDLTAQLLKQWGMRSSEKQIAFDLLYALGMAVCDDASAGHAQVVQLLSADLTVAGFRLACAHAFARRVSLNDRLLAVLDRVGSAPFARLTQLTFGDSPAPDLPARLLVWEALGIVERGRKDIWRITQAGRMLVAALPPIAITIEDDTTPISIPATPDTDWLNVL